MDQGFVSWVEFEAAPGQADGQDERLRCRTWESWPGGPVVAWSVAREQTTYRPFPGSWPPT